MKEKILEAVIEMEYNGVTTFEECLEYFSPSELIDIWLRYEGIIGYSQYIKMLYEQFYILVPKN